MSACKHPGDNHSDDTVSVFHGATEPLTLCGYHASRLDSAMFANLREEGVIK